MADDNVTPFPEREREPWLCGPYQPEWRVNLDGREIPNLTGWREGEKTWLCVDRRFAQEFTTDEDARNAAVLIAQAMAIGAGYSHYGANSKDMPFAPIAVGLPGVPYV